MTLSPKARTIIAVAALVAAFIAGFFIANGFQFGKKTDALEQKEGFKNPDSLPSIKGPTGPPPRAID